MTTETFSNPKDTLLEQKLELALSPRLPSNPAPSANGQVAGRGWLYSLLSILGEGARVCVRGAARKPRGLESRKHPSYQLLLPPTQGRT